MENLRDRSDSRRTILNMVTQRISKKRKKLDPPVLKSGINISSSQSRKRKILNLKPWERQPGNYYLDKKNCYSNAQIRY